jgi:hypothetical protein
MKFCLTLAATVLLGAISLEAHAQQPWLADRAFGEGIGVRVGDLELHPGIAGQVGYDSNYFLRAPSEDPLAAYVLRVTPSISLSTLGAQRGGGAVPASSVIFRGGAYASFNELIAADSAHSSDFSDQRNVDLGSDLALTLFPQSRVGVDSYLNFVRMVQPSNDTDTQDAFNRDSLRAGAGVTWRPGGGLFDWRLGYEFLYNYFEKDAFRSDDNYQNTVNMRTRWRFLPRTALLYDGSYTRVTYASNVTQNDGDIVRSSIGLNGLLTTRLSLLGMVGWAGTFYDQGRAATPQQFDSITGQAELKWFITGGGQDVMAAAPVGLSYASLGYTRDVSNSYLGNFYQRDRGYAGISYLLGGMFVTSLNVGIANLRFPETFFADGVEQHKAFSEQRFDASLFSEYRASSIVGINATVNYDQNITPVHIPTAERPGPNGTLVADTQNGTDALEFARWQVFLGVRLFW